jgi:hypothetical protein
LVKQRNLTGESALRGHRRLIASSMQLKSSPIAPDKIECVSDRFPTFSGSQFAYPTGRKNPRAANWPSFRSRMTPCMAVSPRLFQPMAF